MYDSVHHIDRLFLNCKAGQKINEFARRIVRESECRSISEKKKVRRPIAERLKNFNLATASLQGLDEIAGGVSPSTCSHVFWFAYRYI
jgi:hypothetical protein